MTFPPAIDYDVGMPDSLRTQLALQMDEFRTRVTRPTALFDLLIQWGESAIREQGPQSMPSVIAICRYWWMNHRPPHSGSALDTWFELEIAIDSLLETYTLESGSVATRGDVVRLRLAAAADQAVT